MTIGSIRPVFFGMAMGAMMLAMLHGQLTGGSDVGATAMFAFLAAHLALALAAVAATVFAARLSARVRKGLAWLHRPSARHFGLMLLGMALSVGLLHLWLHGGIT